MRIKKIIYSYCVILILVALYSFNTNLGDWKNLTKEEAAVFFTKAKDYNKEDNLMMKMTYTSFEDHEGKKMADKKNGYYIKQKGNYFYKIGTVKVMQNKKYIISTDTVNKIMIVSDTKNSASPCDSQLDYMGYLKNSSSILFKEEGAQSIMKIDVKDKKLNYYYEVYLEKKSEVKEIRIFYGNKIKRNPAITNSYLIQPRLDIHIDSYTLNPVISKDEFDEKKFFSIDGKKIKGKDVYENYRILDQRVSALIKNKK